jgi:hypothetical protein
MAIDNDDDNDNAPLSKSENASLNSVEAVSVPFLLPPTVLPT